MENPFTRVVGRGVLVATDGKVTLVEAEKIFPGADIDLNGYDEFIAKESTPEKHYEVHAFLNHGGICHLIDGFKIESDNFWLDKFCWSQDKIIEFILNHWNEKIVADSSVFFLLKARLDVMIIHARKREGLLRLDCNSWSYDSEWQVYPGDFIIVPEI